MRLFALATSRPPAFSLQGSLNVALAGAIAGAVGAVVLLVVRRFLPVRKWLRSVVFAGICYALATPGFRPPSFLVFALFAPVFLAYGVTLVLMELRFGGGHRLAAPS